MNKTTIYTGLAAAVAATLLLTGCTADGELDIDQRAVALDVVDGLIEDVGFGRLAGAEFELAMQV